MADQSFQDFFASNKNIIISVAIGVAIVVIILYFVIRSNCSQPKCLDYDLQNQIAEDIKEKLKAMDLCDCGADISETTKISQPEKFGNINFY
jgi:hypothetical protein